MRPDGRPPAYPTVSVVIAAYHQPELLREALASALHQSFADLEVLVWDDADDDATRAAAEAFGDERVRYHANRVPVGTLRNRLLAFGETRGRFVAILDQDDRWHAGFLERMVIALEEDDQVTVAFCNHDVIDAGGAVDPVMTESIEATYRAGLRPGRHQPFYDLAITARAVPAAMGSVFRRSVIDVDSFPAGADLTGDLWLGYLAARDGGAAVFVPERLTQYRVHDQSATSAYGRSAKWHGSFCVCWLAMLRDPRLRAFDPELRRLAATSLGRLAAAHLRDRDLRAARASARLAVRYGGFLRGGLVLGTSYLPEATRIGALRLMERVTGR